MLRSWLRLTLLMLRAEPCHGTVQGAVDATVHHNRDDMPLKLFLGTSNALLLVLRSAS